MEFNNVTHLLPGKGCVFFFLLSCFSDRYEKEHIIVLFYDDIKAFFSSFFFYLCC